MPSSTYYRSCKCSLPATHTSARLGRPVGRGSRALRAHRPRVWLPRRRRARARARRRRLAAEPKTSSRELGGCIAPIRFACFRPWRDSNVVPARLSAVHARSARGIAASALFSPPLSPTPSLTSGFPTRATSTDSKTFKKPRRPFEKERLDNELKTVGEYGLRNKRELWRVQFALNKLRNASRVLLTLDEKDPKRIFEGEAIMRRMYRYGLLVRIVSLRIPFLFARCASRFGHRRPGFGPRVDGFVTASAGPLGSSGEY